MKLTLIEWMVILVILGIFGAVMASPYFGCRAKAEAQGLECEWGIFQGCMVKIDGKWIDYDRLRIMD